MELTPHTRQRLVGAIVLVALGIIFVPMILHGGRRSELPVFGSNVPAQPGYHFEPLPVPRPEPAAFEPRQRVVERADVGKKAAAAVEPAPAPAVVAPAAVEAKAVEPPRPKVQASGPRAWVVQAGSFGSAKNALGLRDKLRTAGYPAFVEKLEESGSAPAYRVRIGPEGDRDAADAMRAKVEKEFTLKAIVMNHP